MKPAMTGVLAALALVLLAPTLAIAEEDQIDGARVYAETCNRCHNFRSPVEFDDAQWAVVTTHMRIIGGLPGDEVRAVLEYLRANNNPPRRPRATLTRVKPSPPGDPVARGRALVLQKGCIGCHVVEGLGGTMGPKLDGIAQRRSESFVLRQLQNPQGNKPGSLMPNRALAPEEIEAIWAYLRGTGEGP